MTTSLTVALLENHTSLKCCAVASAQLFLAGDHAGALHIIDWILPHPAAPSRAAAPRPVLRPAPRADEAAAAPELPGKPR